MLNGSRQMLQASSELSSKVTEDDGVEMCDIDGGKGEEEEKEVKFAMGSSYRVKDEEREKIKKEAWNSREGESECV